MEPSIFTDIKTGEVRRYYNLNTGKDDWLFIPNELPPRWDFPGEFWPLLVEARELLGTLNGIGQTLPNPELLLRPLQSREAITSSQIEGTYVTPRQILLYELDPSEPTSATDQVADWKEVFNYSAALKEGCRLLKELPIATRLLHAMHKILMSGVRGQGKSPGNYRKLQNQIGHAGRYVPPPPTEVHRLMGNFDEFINTNNGTFDPLVLCYLAHYQFETIHPYVDGNGRVGRAMLALMVQQQLGHSMPWLYMSAYFEKNKEEYSDCLLRVSTHGDWDRWIKFCLYGTVIQSRDAIARCGQFNEARVKFHDQISIPSPRSHDIIESLFASPVVSIINLRRHFDITYHTAKKDLEKLVEAGILKELPDSRPRSFYAARLMRIAYDESPWDEEETESLK